MDLAPETSADKASGGLSAGKHRPLGILAELTHRCPLRCPYCSNPTSYAPTGRELVTQEWMEVIRQAGALGILHALFSGGEPLVRPDLARLVEAAREAGLYTNLITSGIGLSRSRAEELQKAGLESIQISVQADEATFGDRIAGTRAHEQKLQAARVARDLGFPLTLNVVLHRGNIERTRELVALAEELGAHRLELAHTQFYGWAFRNQKALLPTRAQVEEADRIATSAKTRLRGKMEILYVLPDFFGDRPKPCMNGWGRRYLTVDPVGDVLPCPTAREIRTLPFENIRRRPLRWIWEESEAFNRFRGTEWMPEPCRSCPEREMDFGGCRCQAALLAGDAARTDPACALSPDRAKLESILEDVESKASSGGTAPFGEKGAFEYRTNPSPGGSR